MSTEHLVATVGQVLDALMGHQDDPRQKAEAYLQQLTIQQPGEILLVLAQIGSLGVGGYQLDQRFLSLILLRRLAFRPLAGLYMNPAAKINSSPFDIIPERVRSRIETVICTGLKDEVNVRMRKGLGDCAAGWAEQSAKRQRPCLPLPPVMLQLVASREPFHRFTPFQILTLCPTLLVDSVEDPVPAEQLAQLLAGGLNDASVDVRIEAMKAVLRVMTDGFSSEERNRVGGLLVSESFNALMQLPLTTLQHALLPLLDLTQRYPKFVMPFRSKVLPFMLALLAPPSSCLPDFQFGPYKSYMDVYESWSDIANLASEVVMALVEGYTDETLSWESGRVLKEYPSLLMGWVVAGLDTDGEECEDWLTSTEGEEFDSYPIYPEEALSRLSYATDTLLPSLMGTVRSLLGQIDWRCRYVALCSLAGVLDDQFAHLQGSLAEFLKLISPYAQDPHPRVRYAFLHCLGLLSASLPESTQHTAIFLPLLVQLLQDPQPRVQAEACMCLEYYFDAKPTVEEWRGSAEAMSQSLFALLTAGSLFVQEAVLSTLNCISSEVVPEYEPFYRIFMALVIQIIEKGTDPAQFHLVGRAALCAVAIGRAVGKKRFSQDAVHLGGVMLASQNTITSTEDSRSKAFMDAWCNFCYVMEEDFEPFLPHVLPPVLRAGAYLPDETTPNTTSSITREVAEDDDDSPGRTSEMDEKAIALDNLKRYAKALGVKFKPYIQQVMIIALDGLSSQNSDNVREISPKLVTAMLQSAKDAGDPSLIDLDRIFTTLTTSLANANYYSEIAVDVQCLTDCLQIIAMPLPPALIRSVLASLSGILDDLGPQREIRVLQQENFDEVQKTEEEEVEAEENSALKTMIHALEVLAGVQDEKADVQTMLERTRAIGKSVMKG